MNKQSIKSNSEIRNRSIFHFATLKDDKKAVDVVFLAFDSQKNKHGKEKLSNCLIVKPYQSRGYFLRIGSFSFWEIQMGSINEYQGQSEHAMRAARISHENFVALLFTRSSHNYSSESLREAFYKS